MDSLDGSPAQSIRAPKPTEKVSTSYAAIARGPAPNYIVTRPQKYCPIQTFMQYVMRQIQILKFDDRKINRRVLQLLVVEFEHIPKNMKGLMKTFLPSGMMMTMGGRIGLFVVECI